MIRPPFLPAVPARSVFAFVSVFVCALLFSLVAGCHPPNGDPNRPDATQRQRVYIGRIDDDPTFQHFSKQVGDERFTKFVIDLRSGEVIFFDVNVYPMHVDFVFQQIYRAPLSYHLHVQFNKNYELEKPEFLLGYLVHHVSLDLWTFTFWEGDKLSAAHVLRTWDALQKTFYQAAALKFRPDSSLHEELLASLPPELSTISNDEIYKKLPYTPFNEGQSIGRLRLVTDADDPWQLQPDEVVIVQTTLPDLPRVSGIISETFSSPLSHVALRARAWGIAHVGLRDASQKLKDLIGQWVYFEARTDGYTIRAATPQEIQDWQAKANAPHEVRIPRADLTEQRLLDLSQLDAAFTPAFGAKSSNLGQIIRCGIDPEVFQIPPGFGIPIHFYQDHMQRNGLDSQLESILTDPALLTDQAARKARLETLQAAIKAAPLDPALLDAVEARISTLTGTPTKTPTGTQSANRGVFVRSSTNAEDLPDFNGAGLYDTVPNVRDREHLADAIRQVWASVWNFRAFEERTHAGIDQRQVFGAILIQVGVEADAAGVLVTRNVFDLADTRSFTINAKRGLGIKVVEGLRVAEQLLFNPDNSGIKVISRSDDTTRLVFDPDGGVREVPNLDPGQPVLSDTRVQQLGAAAQALIWCFPPDLPLDVEWLFQQHTLSIVQVRPYLGL